MTTSKDTVPPITLTLSARDIAYLVAAHAVARAAIGHTAGYVSEDLLMTNVESLIVLHADDHYTARESNALMEVLCTHLPLDGPVTVVSGFPMQSTSSFVQ